MLLDNKTKTEDKEYSTVYDLLRNYIEQEKVDIVTGYFSISALARIKDEIIDPEGFRMVLGNLLREDNQQNKVLNLLRYSLGILQVLNLSQSEAKAVDFLRQKVHVKTIQRSFCHAKTCIYYDPDTRKNFHIIEE